MPAQTMDVKNSYLRPCSNAPWIIMRSINIILNPITDKVQNVIQNHTRFLPFSFLTS